MGSMLKAVSRITRQKLGLRDRSELKLPRPRTGLLGLRLSARVVRTREFDRLVAVAAPEELLSKRSALADGGPDPARLPSGVPDCPEDEERP